MKTATCEVWVVTDENGDYACGNDRATAWTRYCEDVGHDESEPLAIRWATLTVQVPLPVVIAATVTVPAVEEEALVSVQ